MTPPLRELITAASLVLAATAVSPGAGAQSVQPLGDINTTVDVGSDTLAAGARWVFVDSSGRTWTTDGTSAGTVPLLYGWTGPSVIAGRVRTASMYNGASYYVTATYNAQRVLETHLVRTDGTSSGTTLVYIAVPTQVDAMVAAGSSLFLRNNGTALWRTDAATDAVALLDSSAGVRIDDMTAVGNQLFFTATPFSPAITQVWKSDGTQAGTVQVPTGSTGNISPGDLGTAGGKVFFWADDGSGKKLWSTDGTAAGTLKMSDAIVSGQNGRIVEFLGRAFVLVNRSLVQSDGTAAGTGVVKSFTYYTSSDYLNPYRMVVPVVAGNGLYWLGADDISGQPVVWRSDGTSAGTVAIPLPTGAQDPKKLVAFGGTVYVDVTIGAGRAEIYKIDGNGPFTLVDTGVAGVPTTVLPNGYLVSEPDAPGPYASSIGDGTPANTHVLHTASGFGNGPSNCTGFPTSTYFSPVQVGSTVVFWANDGVHGCELWRSDGTAAGTFLLRHIVDGEDANSPPTLFVLNGVAYFFEPGGLWRTDGTPSGTTMVTSLTGGPWLGSAGGLAYFTRGNEVWRTDGTASGTFGIGLIPPGTSSDISPPYSNLGLLFGTLGGRPYFVRAVSGCALVVLPCSITTELWTTDGTAAGTAKVMDLGTGSARRFAGDKLYYAVGNDLYSTDGTVAGTRNLASFADAPKALFAAASQVYVWTGISLNGNTITNGTLYRIGRNGTGVKQLTGSTSISYPDIGIVFRDSIFFTVAEAHPAPYPINVTYTYTIWTTDGAAAPFKVLDGGPQSTAVTSEALFVSANGAIYHTDGTLGGTASLGQGGMYSPMVVGTSVFFFSSGSAGRAGLWRATASTLDFLASTTYSSPAAMISRGIFFFDGYSEPAFYGFASNPFAFPSAGPIQPGVAVTSVPSLVGGMAFPMVASASNAQLCVSSGNACTCDVAAFAPAATVANGQYICLRTTSSATLGATVMATLNLGSTTATFSVTTAAPQTLSVALAGTGSGRVLSFTPGIDCGTDCTEVVPQGFTYWLAAVQSLGSSFRGWSGGCTSGDVACGLPMNANTSVTATFGPSVRRGLAGDLDGDGIADILWRNGTTSASWLMSASGYHAANAIAPPTPGAVIVDKGDFDGDGKTDLLWRTSAGEYWITLQDGLTTTASRMLLPSGTGWEVVAKGDFDGDGKTDLVWRGPTGEHRLAIMNGAGDPGYFPLADASLQLTVAFVADFNGDGKSDIVWTGADGSTTMYLMDGTAILEQKLLLAGGTGWSVTHFADFDGDGMADLVWRNVNGQYGIWFMHGTSAWTYASLIGAGTGWNLRFVRDLDGDGKSDVIWSHPDGRWAAWLMKGGTAVAYAYLQAAGSGATLIASEDYDGDGRDDLLWLDSRGGYSIWYMAGLTPKNFLVLMSGGGTGWEPLP